MLAHSTHVKGQGTYDAATGVETPRVHGDARHRDLRRALPSASISAIAIPTSIDIAAWTGREREGILVVPRAGEMLYRLKR